MSLEDDGLIRARRGVGRFVAVTLPRIGIERIRPFEEVLGGPGQHLEIKQINDDGGGCTLLAGLNNRFGRVLGARERQISLSQLGPWCCTWVTTSTSTRRTAT